MYRRVHEALIEAEINASQRRVARLMRQHGRRGKQFRRYTVTTKPGKRLPDIPDRLQRTFTAARPNQAWVADITYVRTRQGWLYLAAILDLFSRRIVPTGQTLGWAMSNRLTDDLTLSALKMALIQRQPEPGLIHHSDRGSQYTSHAYQRLLKLYRKRLHSAISYRTPSAFEAATETVH